MSMNQSELDVVKQEMVRVNIDILEVSELKLTGMGEFNSDECYIYYCGQEFLRRNLKNERMILIHLQCKPFNKNSSLCHNH